jgi:hypothetical protein
MSRFEKFLFAFIAMTAIIFSLCLLVSIIETWGANEMEQKGTKSKIKFIKSAVRDFFENMQE